uniref:Tcpgp2 protein n=1 Tax=Trypanosoma cruzi TaxID=5693 RepID=Q9NCS5_TRYCR|nr:tcpgp2 protein [Trypanosoma cruzi]
MSRRLREMWGLGEPYTPMAESTATWPQRLYYTWISEYIQLAKKSECRWRICRQHAAQTVHTSAD